MDTKKILKSLKKIFPGTTINSKGDNHRFNDKQGDCLFEFPKIYKGLDIHLLMKSLGKTYWPVWLLELLKKTEFDIDVKDMTIEMYSNKELGPIMTITKAHMRDKSLLKKMINGISRVYNELLEMDRKWKEPPKWFIDLIKKTVFDYRVDRRPKKYDVIVEYKGDYVMTVSKKQMDRKDVVIESVDVLNKNYKKLKPEPEDIYGNPYDFPPKWFIHEVRKTCFTYNPINGGVSLHYNGNPILLINHKQMKSKDIVIESIRDLYSTLNTPGYAKIAKESLGTSGI